MMAKRHYANFTYIYSNLVFQTSSADSHLSSQILVSFLKKHNKIKFSTIINSTIYKKTKNKTLSEISLKISL